MDAKNAAKVKDPKLNAEFFAAAGIEPPKGDTAGMYLWVIYTSKGEPHTTRYDLDKDGLMLALLEMVEWISTIGNAAAISIGKASPQLSIASG